MRFPIQFKRLRILGVALGLSAIASILGIVCYCLPRDVLPAINRIQDYVVLNDAFFLARSQQWLANRAHFPDYDDDNEQLRFIAVNEASLKEPTEGGLGQFPWPRTIDGKMLERLARAGAKIVTFDFLFLENSANAADDRAFAAGMRKQPTVLGFTLVTTSGGVLGVSKPVPLLANAAHDLGFTTVDNPGGWLVGQYFTLTATNDAGKTTTYHSLASATVQNYAGKRLEPIDAWGARFGDEIVPLDGYGQFTMLPFEVAHRVDLAQQAGGPVSRAGTENITPPFVQTVSFADAVHFDDDTMKAFAKDNIVVIGPTAQALGDFIVTPNGRYPGVFANLRLMDQLMRHKYIRRVPPWLDIALIVSLPLLVGFLVTQLRATVGIGIAVAAGFLYTVIATSTYAYTLHWLNLIHVTVSTILAALFVALYRTVTEGADKRMIREMFGKHVSPALVDQMMAKDDPLGELGLSGKRVKVTVFYSDIRGFTAMSEKMTPEQIYGALNEYFQEMCNLVFEHDGYVDKFIGDCLMAVYSLEPRSDDAYHAVESALKQQEKILDMMAEWAKQGRPVFTVGMGCNTGEVVMGNLGSNDRLNYTVIGDNVNTAARLYNVALGGQIIISESTYNEVKDRFIVNELTPVYVKGKVLPLRNFEVLGRLRAGEPNPSTLLDPENLPQATIAADH